MNRFIVYEETVKHDLVVHDMYTQYIHGNAQISFSKQCCNFRGKCFFVFVCFFKFVNQNGIKQTKNLQNTKLSNIYIIKILNKKCFEKIDKKYIFTHKIKLVRFQMLDHVCILFLCINLHKLLAFQSRTKSWCFYLLSPYQQLFTIEKKPATNPDGSNEIVSMSIHNRNDETFPIAGRGSLSLFIPVCFFKENICK